MIKLEDTLPFNDSIAASIERQKTVAESVPALQLRCRQKWPEPADVGGQCSAETDLAGSASQTLVHHVLVRVQQAVVPEEEAVGQRDLLSAFHHQLRNVEEMAKVRNEG